MFDVIDSIGLRKIADLIVVKTAKKAALDEHVSNKSNPHGVTKSQVGLGNVPNVATNNQTPTYTTVEALAKLVTGEKLGVAFGKIAKAVDELITHLDDKISHITAEERTAWNGKAAGSHTHSAASQSAAGFMSAADKKKLDGVAASANNYSLPLAAASVRGGAKIGYAANGKNYPVQLSNEQMFVNVPWTDTNTTYSNMTGASASAAGKAGLVPAPAKGNQAKYLRGDGTWQTPPDTNTTYSVATQSANGLMSAADKKKLDGVAASANNYSLPIATASARGGAKIGYTANGKNYPVQLSNEQMFVNVPWTDTNTTYSNMTGASASAAGKAGLVPAPAKGNQAKYLRGDGTWQTPPDTNTTYSAATQSANGLMSAADKKKLDGVAEGANKYTHPSTSGNKHIPSGGSSGQILRWSADGTAVWDDESGGSLPDLSVFSDFKSKGDSNFTADDTNKKLSFSSGGASLSASKTISSLSFSDWVAMGYTYLKLTLGRSGGTVTLKLGSVYQISTPGVVVIDMLNYTSTYDLTLTLSWTSSTGGGMAYIQDPVVSVSR